MTTQANHGGRGQAVAAELCRQCSRASGLVLLAAGARRARLASGGLDCWRRSASVVLVVWLRAGTFAYFRLAEFREHGAVWRAFRHSLRHIVALALWAVVLAVVLWCLISAADLSAAVWRLALAEAARIAALCQPAPVCACCWLCRSGCSSWWLCRRFGCRLRPPLQPKDSARA